MEIMATSKNYGKKKVRITSGIFWTLMGKNPIMEKSDAGAACLSWTFFFFHNSVGYHTTNENMLWNILQCKEPLCLHNKLMFAANWADSMSLVSHVLLLLAEERSPIMHLQNQFKNHPRSSPYSQPPEHQNSRPPQCFLSPRDVADPVCTA